MYFESIKPEDSAQNCFLRDTVEHNRVSVMKQSSVAARTTPPVIKDNKGVKEIQGICKRHFLHELKITNKSGAVYTACFTSNCSFRHVKVAFSTRGDLLKVVELMAAPKLDGSSPLLTGPLLELVKTAVNKR
jgi:hypothetical protein